VVCFLAAGLDPLVAAVLVVGASWGAWDLTPALSLKGRANAS
jgi:hypothetical protein